MLDATSEDVDDIFEQTNEIIAENAPEKDISDRPNM